MKTIKENIEKIYYWRQYGMVLKKIEIVETLENFDMKIKSNLDKKIIN